MTSGNWKAVNLSDVLATRRTSREVYCTDVIGEFVEDRIREQNMEQRNLAHVKQKVTAMIAIGVLI